MQKDLSDSEAMLRQAHGLDRTRRIMLLLNAATYSMWMVGLAMNTGTTYGGRDTIWGLLQIIGPVLWILSIGGVLWSSYLGMRRKDLTALIDDERTKDRTLRAFQVGYLVLLLPLAAIYTASYFAVVDIRFVMPLLMAVAVATPSITYALFFRG